MLPRSISQNPSGLLVSFLRVLIRTSLSFLLMESLYQGGVGALCIFIFLKGCFVNLNDLFLPSLSLSSAQQSCSFKFKARFIWCFLPPPPLPVDRCVAFLLSPDFNPTPGTNFSISQLTEESIRSGSWFGGGRGMCAHHSREAMPAKQ